MIYMIHIVNNCILDNCGSWLIKYFALSTNLFDLNIWLIPPSLIFSIIWGSSLMLSRSIIAEKEGISIYTVGLGSAQGVPVPEYSGGGKKTGFKKDRQGNVVTTKLDVVTLQKIAYQTGGKYYLATSGEAELDEIYV